MATKDGISRTESDADIAALIYAIDQTQAIMAMLGKAK